MERSTRQRRQAETAIYFLKIPYGHASEILSDAFSADWMKIQEALRRLTISTEELKQAGGNEPAIPKKSGDILYPYGWREIRITGDLCAVMDMCENQADESYEPDWATYANHTVAGRTE